ncbi:MAG: DUF4258 domain-containing protein [Candidatus Micrarchaeaceae archaeon]
MYRITYRITISPPPLCEESIKYTKHALRRGMERGIDRKKIEETLMHPERVTVESIGAVCYEKEIGGNRIHVLVNPNAPKGKALIITVYSDNTRHLRDNTRHLRV